MSALDERRALLIALRQRPDWMRLTRANEAFVSARMNARLAQVTLERCQAERDAAGGALEPETARMMNELDALIDREVRESNERKAA